MIFENSVIRISNFFSNPSNSFTESGKFLNEEGKEYQKGAVPGSAKLEDKDGNGSITADDKKIIGSKLPSFLLSMGNRFDYKNIYLFIIDRF